MKQHEHRYPDNPSWVWIERGVTTNIYLCEEPGCSERKEE